MKTKRLISRCRPGNFMTEYAILFSVVAAAFTAIGIVMNRALQARVYSATKAYTGITATITDTSAAGTTATFGALDQYQSYADESFYQTYSENVTQRHMGGGAVKLEKVSDINARAAGGSQKQRTARAGTATTATNRRDTIDKLFAQ